jgi:Domain of unknown function (DUF1330)
MQRNKTVCAVARLLDHLIGAGEHCRRHFKAERFGDPEIDHEFVFGRLLDRQVARLFALENAIDVAGGLAVLVDDFSPIGDQASGSGAFDSMERAQAWYASSGYEVLKPLRDKAGKARISAAEGVLP